MAPIDGILSEALSRIKPTAKGLPAFVTATLRSIQVKIDRKKIKATAILGGSYAKGTHLADDFDVDIFVRFDAKTYDGKDISTLLETALAGFKAKRVHGSRDYFQFVKDKVHFEIIPVLMIDDPAQARNVTDCSPLHVRWVAAHINGYHDDIRLAKQFLKAAGAYGAESYIRGFSGHVTDLLVIHHKGFIPLLKAAAGWKPPVVLDIMDAHRGKALTNLNQAKTQSPIIIVDPVQPERNASASLSPEKFELFTAAARRFLLKPDISSFDIKKLDIASIKKQGPCVIATARPLPGKEDVIGSKLLQAFEAIAAALKPFEPAKTGWEWNIGRPATFYFILKKTELEPTQTITGPPARLQAHAQAFQEKHPSAKAVKGKMVAIEKREARTPLEVLKPILSSPYIKERATRVSATFTTP